MPESDEPNESGVLAVFHFVVADMPDKAAYGCINQDGEAVVQADRGAFEGDPQARENASKVAMELFASLMAATPVSLGV